jgi:hypothetical protein
LAVADEKLRGREGKNWEVKSPIAPAGKNGAGGRLKQIDRLWGKPKPRSVDEFQAPLFPAY